MHIMANMLCHVIAPAAKIGPNLPTILETQLKNVTNLVTFWASRENCALHKLINCLDSYKEDSCFSYHSTCLMVTCTSHFPVSVFFGVLASPKKSYMNRCHK